MDSEEELDKIINDIKEKREHIAICKDMVVNYLQWYSHYASINGLVNDIDYSGGIYRVSPEKMKFVLKCMPDSVRKLWDIKTFEQKIEILKKDISLFANRDEKELEARWYRAWFYIATKGGESIMYEATHTIKLGGK